MEKIHYRNWTLWVDKVATQQAYDRFAFEPCDCFDCQNYEQQKADILPQEFVDLLTQLGIDPLKYASVSQIRPKGHLLIYEGWYHFKGEFQGVSAMQPIEEGGSTLILQPISDGFAVGFHHDVWHACFDQKDNLVQLEFEIAIPWVLDSPDSSYPFW